MPQMNGIEFLSQGHDALPRRQARPAHRLRRYRSRAPRHQRNPPAPLPAQALGSARAEPLSRCWTICWTTGWRAIVRRSKASACWARAGRRPPTNCAPFSPGNSVPYRWLDADTAERDPEVRRALDSLPAGSLHARAACARTARSLSNQRMAAVADRIGLRSQAEKQFYDLVIVGGGPAGLGRRLSMARPRGFTP